MGRGWGEGVNGGIVILATFEFNFIREHKILVQHPSNDILINAIVFATNKKRVNPSIILEKCIRPEKNTHSKTYL